MQEYFSKITTYIQERRWLYHVLFWLVLFLIQSLGVESFYNEKDVFIHKLLVLPPKILTAYALIYYQVPELLYKKRYILFAISFLISSYIFAVISRLTVVYAVEEIIRPKPFNQEPVVEILTDIYALYDRYLLGIYFPALVMWMLKLIKEQVYKKSEIEQLEKEKVSAELSFFKAQIHPHFLFNTLNNLYVLTLQKSDNASETVLKLSEMLDYMLYQCNDDRVTIDKEIKLIENYIDLEQLRYGERLKLNFNKTIDNPKTQIAPLILVSLIENAFKHGASGAIKNPHINIDIKVEKEQLFFSVYNTKAKLEQEDKTNFKEGIGINNTKSQLQLLYPNKHNLEIIDEELSYQVKLHIDLQ
jgi:sensor histidine kinase YesM